MAGNRWRGSRHDARILRGRAPGRTAHTLPQCWPQSRKNLTIFGFANAGLKGRDAAIASPAGHKSRFSNNRDYLALTELTSMVSPFKTPVTVAFFPACWSRVARAIWSAVSKMYIFSPTTSAYFEP